jgi:hypothetical protein
MMTSYMKKRLMISLKVATFIDLIFSVFVCWRDVLGGGMLNMFIA